jgi:glycopeptide antibiotics resistance protein
MPDFLALPLFLPGLAILALLGLVVCRWVASRLACSPLHAWILLVSLAIVLAATLTHLRAALDQGPTGPKPCDFSRIWFAPLEVYLRPGDIPGNVLMFIPLGVALGLLPASRARIPLILGALLLPVVVETTQLAATVLDRACQSGDVVDNLAGLVVGLFVGGVAAAIGNGIAALRRRGSQPER